MTRWLEVARSFEGIAEVAGKGSNPVILGWLQNEGGGKSWVKDDSTPWCGATMAGIFTAADMADAIPSEPLRARAWLETGEPCDLKVGAIVVFPRPPDPASGHVGLVIGFDDDGIDVLGGNQKNPETGQDEVCVRRFSHYGRMAPIGYRWPIKTVTPKQLAQTSRIARAAQRQQGDLRKGGTATTSAPVVPKIPVPSPPPAEAGVDGLMSNASWVRSLASNMADFATFGVNNWPWIAGAIALYFFCRLAWDSHLIKQFRTEDHNEGYTAT